jgi:transcriptional regulator with GAF, ATPase, and Fis domain
VQSHAPSHELPLRVDALQSETGQGPCLDAVFEHRTVSVPDMANEDRWPRFAARAAELGAGSMLAFQLFVEGDNLGALNLYSRSTKAFDTESEEIGLLVAAHAAVAFAESRKMTQMHDALASRDLIGQAKGILMERYKITAAQAFILLGHSSSRTNTKLIRVAEHLTGTGELPPRAGS